jgi:uncharacterized RDD family membrane protein YckC
MDTTLTIPSVTGVDLELRIAGPGARSYAFIIDWHIRLLAAAAWFFVAVFVTGFIAGAGGPAGLAAVPGSYPLIVILSSLAIYFLYHPVLEVLMNGRTPGKRMAGVRLVNGAGGTPGVGALLIRNAFRLVDSLPVFYVVGLVTTIVNRQALRIGDIAAGTILVYDESQDERILTRIDSLAVERLGLKRAQLVAELLERWPRLNPDVRSELARQLLDQCGADHAGGQDTLRAALEKLLSEGKHASEPV